MRKLLSIVLAMVLMLTFSVGALAQTPNSKVRVINNSANISARAINEIINDVSASFVYDNGTVVPLESVITIENVTPLNKSGSENNGETYRVTVRSKVESDSNDKNTEGVVASIYLAMTWEDVVGTSNILESLEGEIDITEGTLKSSNVKYSSLGDAGSGSTIQLGTKTSFYRNIHMTGMTPTASYHASFKDATFQLGVSVTPDVFD